MKHLAHYILVLVLCVALLTLTGCGGAGILSGQTVQGAGISGVNYYPGSRIIEVRFWPRRSWVSVDLVGRDLDTNHEFRPWAEGSGSFQTADSASFALSGFPPETTRYALTVTVTVESDGSGHPSGEGGRVTQAFGYSTQGRSPQVGENSPQVVSGVVSLTPIN
jgi:hypothetical protein